MQQLVYFSPVPWTSFAQRPHKFVEWFHSSTNGRVLWVDPYPTRFPKLSDLHQLNAQRSHENFQSSLTWLKVLNFPSIPIEPLPYSGLINRAMWHASLRQVVEISRQAETVLVFGKPSVLALIVLGRLKGVISVYDAMDDFPEFYSGISRRAMSRRERYLVRRVTHVLASSTALMRRLGEIRSDVQLVCNGLDVSILPNKLDMHPKMERKIFGYVGTISSWFDWKWISALAQARPKDLIRLIGPISSSIPSPLPRNIELLPPCSHKDALLAMRDFDVGLIPFKLNKLTASVDPIKYYEYRALGLPIISTRFGEMEFHGNKSDTFISDGEQDIQDVVQKALMAKTDDAEIIRFIAENSWEKRFATAKLF